MRSLHADGRSRRAIWFLLLPIAILSAWSIWFLKAQVARYEVTDRAHLEVDHQAVHVIAEFPPEDVIGRIRPGQHAQMRTRFGYAPTHVTSVGQEVRDGYVRVELAVDRSSKVIPIEQGLPVTVEIEVENVTPAVMLLRSAGRMLDRQPQ